MCTDPKNTKHPVIDATLQEREFITILDLRQSISSEATPIFLAIFSYF